MLVPIACRFVPYDQWLVTHIDDKSKVKQLKLWILSKCNLVQSHGTPTHRSVSPIVFASCVRSRSSVDSQDDGYSEDDEISDQDLPLSPSKHIIYPNPTPPSLPRTHPLVDQYTLLSFSTGSLLEDEFALSWYNLRPYELLEMHPVGFVAPLQRDILTEYIQPYFQAKVRVLRSVWNHKSGRFEAPDFNLHHERTAMDRLAHRLDTLSTKSSPPRSEKKRKIKADWKARCLFINQGILYLCKERVTNPPLQQFPLSTMTALRGTDALERVFSIVTQPRVVCIKFRSGSVSLARVVSLPPSSPSSPISEESRIDKQEPHPCLDSAFYVRQTTELENRCEDPEEAFKEQGEWIVLDMLDDHAFSSILRILHRQASRPISSSFVPPSSFITVAHSSVASPVGPSFGSCDTIPYPEWRVNAVENARMAGMGDVGKAMASVVGLQSGVGESASGNIRQRRQAFSREMQYKTVVPYPSDIYCGPDDENDDDSEMEWEGWMRDLERQCWVKQQKENTSKSAASSRRRYIPVSRSLPWPLLSEVSPSSSPRVGSSSLSMSQDTSPPQCLNIGNVIQESCGHGYRSPEQGYSPEKPGSTTVSTVSVGMTASARRRSSTLLAELGGARRRDRDTGKQGRDPLVGTSVAAAHAVSISGGMQRLARGNVRHAHSSSNLRVSSSPCASDAAESAGHVRAREPWRSKRQNAVMRGAGKLVRGLESAIDFVDEKTID